MLLASKLIERVPDPRNAKEHYELLLRKKNRKLVKQSEIITYQPKTFKNASIVDLFFIQAQKQKSQSMKVAMMMCLNQSILQS